MKYSAIAAALASASAAYAHTTVQAVFINGVDQGSGVGTYIRSPPDNSPVKDLTSSAVACNVNNSPVAKTLEVSSGDVITFEWAHNTRGDDIMDRSHEGPVQVYVAPTSSNGEGAVWAKIFSDGYTSDWATNTLISNGGHVSITVPDLKAGEYLFRPEIVALHEADAAYNVNPARGVQLYMECIQFKVVSAGTKEITDGIDFKTSYTYSDPGLVYNLYTADPKTYVAPGGALSSLAVTSQPGIGPVPATGSQSSATAAVASTTAAAATSTAAAPSPTTAESTTTATGLTTTVAAPTTTAAAATVSAAVSTSRASLSTSKMTTVTIRSSTVAIPTVTSNVATPSASSCPTASADGNSGAAVAKYYQCGGINYTGSTTCVSGTTCVVQNPYYSQCL